MRTSSRGYFRLNSSAKDRIEASLARSTISRKTRAFPDSRRISCLAVSPRAAFRHAITMVPPSRARPIAVALPIPEFAPVTRNTRFSMLTDISRTSRSIHVHNADPASHKDIDHDQPACAVRIHIAVHQAGRDMNEIPLTHAHRLGPRRAVLQSEPPREEESVKSVGPVMMPTRHLRRVQPRPRHEDIARLERLLPEDPGSRLAFFQPGPVDDVDSWHDPPRRGGYKKSAETVGMQVVR